MFKIDDFVVKAMVWRQLWIHVIDCKMSSLQYMNFVIQQLPKETVEQSIMSTMSHLSAMIAYYIPTDKVKDCKA